MTANTENLPLAAKLSAHQGPVMDIVSGTLFASVLSGDCLQVMATLEAGSIDAVITDLPYGTTACKWDAVIPFAPLWEQVRRVLKPNGVFVTTAIQPFTTTLIASNLAGFKYCWVWDKMGGGAFVIAKRRPMQTHEDIVVFCDGKNTYNPQMEDADEKNVRPINGGSSGGSTVQVAGGVAKSAPGYDPKKRFPKTVIRRSRYEAECNSVNRVHPTQKPVGLMRYLIRTYTNPGDTVLDPCCGSGTTGVAAQAEGRNCVLIEREEKYLEITRQRLLAKTKRSDA